MVLRPYQSGAIQGIYNYFHEDTGNPLVVIPTAGGKSLVMATFVEGVLKAYPDQRILIVTHVRELIEQNYTELKKLWPQAPAGIYSAGLKQRDIHARILFAGIQSIHKRVYNVQQCDLVLIDEAHLIPRSSNTMYRRFLSDLARLNPQMQTYMHLMGLTRAMYLAVCKDTDDVYVERVEADPAFAQGLLAKAERVIFAATPPPRISTDPAWYQCRMCDHAPVCHAGAADAAAPDRIQCLTNANVLTTGFNAPGVDLLAMLRPTKSAGLYVQIVGRGCRLAPGKTDCLVLDFAGNIARHGPIDAVKPKRPKGGEDGVAPTKACPECDSIVHASVRTCPDCGHVFPPPELKIEAKASNLDILTSGKSEWVPVTRVSYARHDKPGKPPSLRVDYWSGLTHHSEWICIEHQGYPRQKAASWWANRAQGLPLPRRVDEAIACAAKLRCPSEIAVRPSGRYTEVVGARFP